MCGIVAYVGRKLAQPLLIEGMKRLEYRGYDSAGIAVIDDTNNLYVRRAVGRISVLEMRSWTMGRRDCRRARRHGPHALGDAWRALPSRTPIRTPTTRATSRWRTTASLRITRIAEAVSDEKGHTFSSQTDTEVLAVLIGHLYKELKTKNHAPQGVSVLQRAVQAALHEVRGTYGIAVICKDEPDTLVAARKGRP
jgi:glutamine---fructose-6-phosphate transaminase (isomerizing)